MTSAASLFATPPAAVPRPASAVERQRFELPSSDGTSTVVGDVWLPAGGVAPAAVVQLVHGMAEHIGRYDAFARYLAQRGCAVVGHDHIGHGRSVAAPDSWGVLAPNAGADHLVADIERVRRLADERFSGLPHVLFGHSMGSFALRVFLGRHGAGLAGAIVAGTGWQPRPALAAGALLTQVLGRLRGWDYRSRFVDGIAAGSYGRAFTQREGGPSAWLTRDAHARAAYRDDPATGFLFSVGAYHELFRLVEMSQDRAVVRGMPHDLPVLLIAGSQDPVGGRGAAIPKVAAFMRSCGVADVEQVLYPGARHELLNETNRDEVMADVVAWLAKKGVLDGAPRMS